MDDEDLDDELVLPELLVNTRFINYSNALFRSILVKERKLNC